MFTFVRDGINCLTLSCSLFFFYLTCMFGKSLPDDSPLLAERKRERARGERERYIINNIVQKHLYHKARVPHSSMLKANNIF